MKKILSILFLGILLVGITGCGKAEKSLSVCEELNKMVEKLNDQGEDLTLGNIQNYFKDNSNYLLINGSGNDPFTERPDKPTDAFGYLAKNEDYVLRYSYSLVYDSKNDIYYSIAMGANGVMPYFSEATEIK